MPWYRRQGVSVMHSTPLILPSPWSTTANRMDAAMAGPAPATSPPKLNLPPHRLELSSQRTTTSALLKHRPPTPPPLIVERPRYAHRPPRPAVPARTARSRPPEAARAPSEASASPTPTYRRSPSPGWTAPRPPHACACGQPLRCR
jgi:hypothetical protein